MREISREDEREVSRESEYLVAPRLRGFDNEDSHWDEVVHSAEELMGHLMGLHTAHILEARRMGVDVLELVGMLDGLVRESYVENDE